MSVLKSLKEILGSKACQVLYIFIMTVFIVYVDERYDAGKVVRGGADLRRPFISQDIVVGESPRRGKGNTATGTAWAFDGLGYWMSAEHVVSECPLNFVIDMPSRSNIQKSIVYVETGEVEPVAHASLYLAHNYIRSL